MAPSKRYPSTQSHPKTKQRRRMSKISELVQKFLMSDDVKDGVSRTTEGSKCRVCKLRKHHEVLDSLNSRAARGTTKKRWDVDKNSGIHRVKRHRTSRDQTLSGCVQKCSKGEGAKNMKKYIQKAIDFGVESGYLIPRDTTYKLLRVSSDLMNECSYTSRDRKSVSKVSQIRDRSPRRTPMRFEDYEVQDARRRRRSSRRRRRRRSRSGSRRRRRSRRRGRRRSGSTHEQVIDNETNDNEYDYEKQGEKKSSPDNASRTEGDEQLNQSDGEKTEGKRDDDVSDVSVDEEESEEEEDGKKRDETSKT